MTHRCRAMEATYLVRLDMLLPEGAVTSPVAPVALRLIEGAWRLVERGCPTYAVRFCPWCGLCLDHDGR